MVRNKHFELMKTICSIGAMYSSAGYHEKEAFISGIFKILTPRINLSHAIRNHFHGDNGFLP